jgi:hypothetical protein
VDPLVLIEKEDGEGGGVYEWRIQNASEYLEEELVRLVGCMV